MHSNTKATGVIVNLLKYIFSCLLLKYILIKVCPYASPQYSPLSDSTNFTESIGRIFLDITDVYSFTSPNTGPI